MTPPDLLKKAMEELHVDFEMSCEDEFLEGKPHWAFDNYRVQGAIQYEASHLFYTQPSWGKFFQDKVGAKNTKLLTYAVDEDIYPEVTDKKEYDLGFIGNIMDGDGRKEWIDLVQSKYNCLISTDTITRDIAKVYAKCKIVFNPIRIEEINIRFFEALACGAQLCSYSPSLHMFAEEGKHYLTYKNKDDLFTKIDFLLENPDIAENMAKEARKEVLRRHTYKHRVKEITNFI